MDSILHVLAKIEVLDVTRMAHRIGLSEVEWMMKRMDDEKLALFGVSCRAL